MLVIRFLLLAWVFVGFVLCVVALGLGLGASSTSAAHDRATGVLVARLLCAVTWPIALFTATGRQALGSMFRKAASPASRHAHRNIQRLDLPRPLGRARVVHAGAVSIHRYRHRHVLYVELVDGFHAKVRERHHA